MVVCATEEKKALVDEYVKSEIETNLFNTQSKFVRENKLYYLEFESAKIKKLFDQNEKRTMEEEGLLFKEISSVAYLIERSSQPIYKMEFLNKPAFAVPVYERHENGQENNNIFIIPNTITISFKQDYSFEKIREKINPHFKTFEPLSNLKYEVSNIGLGVFIFE